MTVFVQVRRESGYLQDLLENHLVDGIVADISYPPAERVRSFVRSGGRLLVDPATHLLHLSGNNQLGTKRFRQLSFTDSFSGLGSLSTEGLSLFVSEVIDREIEHGATELISPYFYVQEVRGPPLELTLAANYETRAKAAGLGLESVWTGVMVAEDEIRSHMSRDWLLTRLTNADVDRCYLVVGTNQTGSGPLRDLELVEGLRETVRALSNNGIEVLLGYADPLALGLLVDGLTGFATGPAQSTRRMEISKVRQAKKGGRRAARNYYFRPIMNFLRVDRELTRIVQRGVLRDYLCRCGSCPGSLEASLQLPEPNLRRHYIRGLHEDASLMQALSWDGRLALFRQILQSARTTYGLLARSGVTFDTESGPSHIEVWQQSFG